MSWGVYQSCLICVLSYYSFTSYEHPWLAVRPALLTAAVAFLVLGGYVFLQVRDTDAFPKFLHSPISLPVFAQLQSWLQINPSTQPSGWVDPPLKGTACGVTVAMEAVIMLLAGVALFPGKKPFRIAAGILCILLLAVLTISLCRAAWIVMGIGMMLLLIWRSRWLLFVAPSLLGIAFWSVTSKTNYSVSEAWETATDAGGKMVLWKAAGRLVADHPLLGVGLGNYALPYCENAYLRFYLDFGLLGAVAGVAAAIVFLWVAYRIGRHSANAWKGVAVGSCMAVVVCAIYSITESAPACIVAAGLDRDYYVVSPMFPVLGAVLVIAYRGCTYQRLETAPEKDECQAEVMP